MADPIVIAVTEQIDCVLTDTCIGGDAIGLNSSGNWVRADADAAAAIRAEFFAVHRGVTSGDTIKVARKVILYDADAPYTKGALQFLSGTAGKHTETNPVAAAGTTSVQVLGKALSTDTVYLDSQVPHIDVRANLAGTAAATAANYGNLFVAARPMRLVCASEIHRTLGTDGGAVTLDIEKLAPGTAQDSGLSMIASTFDLKSTNATAVAKGPTTTAADARLNPGDAIALKDTGTLTAVADVAVTITLIEEL